MITTCPVRGPGLPINTSTARSLEFLRAGPTQKSRVRLSESRRTLYRWIERLVGDGEQEQRRRRTSCEGRHIFSLCNMPSHASNHSDGRDINLHVVRPYASRQTRPILLHSFWHSLMSFFAAEIDMGLAFPHTHNSCSSRRCAVSL